MKLKFSFNAPVVLTFSILTVLIWLTNQFFIDFFTIRNFSISRSIFEGNLLSYLRLLTHPLGHSNWEHLFGNITFILLLGPILEEKYGSLKLLLLMIATALVTGLLYILLTPNPLQPLLGASGIVFMFIVLVSIVDIQKGTIPITFLLILMIFVGKEVAGIFANDNVSQLTHIAGGVVGAIFGFQQEEKSNF